MDTISFDELKQMVGELFIENVFLKKKVAYLEDMVKQLTKGRETIEEKEVKPQSPPGD